jgi:hypothetical protein
MERSALWAVALGLDSPSQGDHAMTECYPRDTAKIYHLADRIRLAGRRPGKALPAAVPPAEPLPCVSSSGGWYHEAAIREADPHRKP